MSYFHRKCLARNVSPATISVYMYLFGQCLTSQSDYLESVTYREIAHACHISVSTVASSLKTLSDLRILRITDGIVTFFAPPNTIQTQIEQSKNALINARVIGKSGLLPTNTKGVGSNQPENIIERATSPALGGKRLISPEYLGKSALELLNARK